MTDHTEFEPRLGPIGRGARLQASQLKALSRMARWGKAHKFGRAKMAPGSVWARGRGKGAAAVARHWAEAGRRRVVVITKIAPATGTRTAAFASHLKYLQSDGRDASGSRAAIFDRDQDNVDVREFNSRSAGDEHQFRIVISPEDSGRIENLTDFTRRLMNQVDRDLGTRTDWVAARHDNTPRPHVHVVIRGGNERTGVLIIARKYLTHGLRSRAEALVTQELGPRTWRENSAALNRDISAERFTSIDRALSRSVENGRLDLDPRTGGLPAHDWTRNLARLRHLQTLGIARHVYGPIWQFADDWTDSLARLGQRTHILSRMSPDLTRAPVQRNIVLDLPASGAAWITGRLTSRTRNPAGSGGEIVLVDGIDGRAWVWQASPLEAEELPGAGSIITVHMSASGPGTRRSPQRPAHGLRETQPTRNIRLLVNSWLPLHDLVERRTFTWLDELGEDSIRELSSGFGAEVRAAKLRRLAFLQARPLGLSESENLRHSEISALTQSLESRLDKRFVVPGRREVFNGTYTENIDSAYGRFAVIAGNSRFTLISATDDIAGLRGQTVTVEPGRAPLPIHGQGRTLGR